MSEKIGGAKGTELDDDFILMEKVCISLFGLMYVCVGFNVPPDTKQVISEISLFKQSIALVLTTKSSETEKNCPS